MNNSPKQNWIFCEVCKAVHESKFKDGNFCKWRFPQIYKLVRKNYETGKRLDN